MAFNILHEHAGGSINIKLNGCAQQQHTRGERAERVSGMRKALPYYNKAHGMAYGHSKSNNNSACNSIARLIILMTYLSVNHYQVVSAY